METKDERIAYGAQCIWWDSVHNAGSTATHPLHAASRNVKLTTGNGREIKVGTHGLPCCPHCGSMLFEVPDEKTWFDSVDKYEKNGHPGYRDFIEWQRGKCYPTMEHATRAYKQDTGKSITL